MADLDEIRAGVRARLASKAAAPQAEHPPRYDEVFAAGVEWLDGLAGEPMTDITASALQVSRDSTDEGRA